VTRTLAQKGRNAMPDTLAADSIASAPMPTPKTLRRRRNVPIQLVRFVAINLKMMRVIARGHG
jgi:hypothetical protein